MGIILHLYPSTIENESRIFRATNAISITFKNAEIHICGIHKDGLPTEEKKENGFTIFRLKINKRGLRGFKSFFFMKDWEKGIVEKYRNTEIKIVHCHSLLDLSVGVSLKKIHKNCKLIYDAHELETERNGLKGLKKVLEKRKEKKLIKFADEVIVVNDSIANWYVKTYSGISLTVVKNISRFERSEQSKVDIENLRLTYNVPDNHLLFLYIGYLHKGRGIEMLLNTFSDKVIPHHVVFIGYGELEPLIKENAKCCNKIHFHEKVSEDMVVPISSSADIGLALIENTCLSYYLCLPNKLYECLYAGIPVIVSNFPEMEAFINKYNAGWTAIPDYINFKKLILSFTIEEVQLKKETLLKTKIDEWKNEEKLMIELYKKLLLNDNSY